jgi:23S rRNA pseudouridine2605 synthase
VAKPPASRPVRLQKIIAAAGVGSRRAAEELLRAGRVRVNDRPARLGESADPEADVVTLDGVPLHAATHAYWMLNKPRGVLSTVRDTHSRATVVDLLPDGQPRLYPVGRLDRDTEGLLLLTNDGELAHALLHPSFESEREYRVTVKRRIARELLRRLAAGVRLDDGVTAPARVGSARYDATSDTSRFTLTLIEGRKRQIRRSLAALGHPVVELLRVRMGPLRLGRLASGSARSLSRGEIDTLLRLLSEARRKRPRAGGGEQP